MRGDGTIILDILNTSSKHFSSFEWKPSNSQVELVPLTCVWNFGRVRCPEPDLPRVGVQHQLCVARLQQVTRINGHCKIRAPVILNILTPPAGEAKLAKARAGRRSAVQWIMDNPETNLKSRFVRFGASYILPIGTAPARS